MSTAEVESRPSAFSIEHLTVDFGSHRVLDDVSVSFGAGTINALLGPNGSGKSTLIKAMSGLVTPKPSTLVRLGGSSITGGLSPADSRRLGLRFVHQDLGLIPEQSVMENLYLSNAYPTTLGRISWRQAREEAIEALGAVGLGAVHPKSEVRALRHVDRVLIAVARALMHLPDGRGFLFVDEPTAALGESDSEWLLDSLRRLATEHGVGVVLVTHRIREVLRYAGSVTILQDGRVFSRVEGEATHVEDQILSALGLPTGLGRSRTGEATPAEPPLASSSGEGAPGNPVLVLEGIRGRVVRDVNLRVRPGEIIGVTGLEGSGKEELFLLLSGQARPTAGSITVLTRTAALSSTADLLRRGVGLVPGDRAALGGIADLTVAENLYLPQFHAFRKGGWFHSRTMNRQAREALVRYGVEPPQPDRLFGTLSGGNQQKTIVARWLVDSPELLLLQEPTAGVDVASRQRIYSDIRGAVADGMAALVISSDVAELSELCDRVVVLVDGRVEAELSGSLLTAERLSQASFTALSTQETGADLT